ncbi:MAG: DUF7064 domain-containing protein [Panacagrimonas sp.]
MKSTLSPNRPIPILDPLNDGRHALKEGPLERESVPYIIVLPDEGLAAFCYTWVNKDSKAGSAFVVFGPGAGDQPIAEAVDGIEIPSTMNFDDWRVGAVHLRHDLKLRTADISLNSARAGIEARFEAAHPAYAYGFHPDGCPDWAATNRTEQAGTVSGHIRVGDRKVAFNTTGARDHSWGTRDWQAPQHWKWLHAQAGPECCVHFWQIQARGRTDLRGYVFRDGRMAEVDGVEIDFDKDAQYRQTRIDAVVHDTAGRTTRVTGNFFAVYPMIPGPHTTLNEGALRCEIDGKAGVGWSEFMWPTAYLDYLRAQAG